MLPILYFSPSVDIHPYILDGLPTFNLCHSAVLLPSTSNHQAKKIQNDHPNIIYKLLKNLPRTNFWKIVNLPTFAESSNLPTFTDFAKPTNLKTQKPANYELFCWNQGGDRPPLDSQLSQPWLNPHSTSGVLLQKENFFEVFSLCILYYFLIPPPSW